MPYTFTYTVTLSGVPQTFTVTTADTPSGGPYAVQSITGTIGGSPITGPISYAGSDNVEGTSSSFFDGLDANGVSFTTQNGGEYNVFAKNNELFVTTNTGQNYAGVPATYATTAPACFLHGTAIATPSGGIEVQDLAVGDLVLTASGVARPIVWIGHRSYVGKFALSNPQTQPIRLRAGCLGEGLPRRDLLVSANHAIFVDGILIPAGELVNGNSIVRERGMDDVRYFHIELETHDVLLAEGAPAESFVDDESRGQFHNAAEHVAAAVAGPTRFCAPRLSEGYAVQATRDRLASLVAQLEAA